MRFALNKLERENKNKTSTKIIYLFYLSKLVLCLTKVHFFQCDTHFNWFFLLSVFCLLQFWGKKRFGLACETSETNGSIIICHPQLNGRNHFVWRAIDRCLDGFFFQNKTIYLTLLALFRGDFVCIDLWYILCRFAF